MNAVVVHYKELALKGRNRPWFVRMLVRNLRVALAGTGVAAVRPVMGRLEIELGAGAQWTEFRDRIGKSYPGYLEQHDVSAPGAKIYFTAPPLFLDLTTCTRCLGANRSLEAALGRVGDVLRAAGVEPEVNKVRVGSAEHARALRFVSSPTIRIDGEDVALELRESPCGSEACTDGCGADTACRVWVYRGVEYTEPPVEMVVDAILRRVYGGAASVRSGRPSATSAPSGE